MSSNSKMLFGWPIAKRDAVKLVLRSALASPSKQSWLALDEPITI